MANFLTFILIVTILLNINIINVNGCYTSIISFGDSLADTGNLKLLSTKSNGPTPHFLFPPYGETFFHKPTGRCSNGRLVIDFLAESLGLPLIPPSQGSNIVTGLGQGVNYAVAGATALDSSFHEARGVVNTMTNASLGVQLGWFKQSLPSICSSVSDCKNLIGNSLILMGEIGGNDYNHAFTAGKSIDDVEAYIPSVIKAIISTVNELVELGAKTLVVPGNLPIGCSAAYLTIFYGTNIVEYDNTTGCITRLNKFAEYHNELLQKELNHIREVHPEVNVIYADYYNAAMQFFRSPNKYGFTNGALKACCGGGGPFNYNPSVECADPDSTYCDQPDTYVNWDGLHLTESAYKLIFESLFDGSYTTPKFNSLCPTFRLQSEPELSSFYVRM
ncbi:GDSL esterase/lipase At1g28580-like [Rutidosis leptorrhynchoides]|uniref:GDSL esterase/lipase At1g28580-like n=1 Tax=Rutidosis leptorrhynchoides TaxID=125765 RepID=UPI003A9A3796